MRNSLLLALLGTGAVVACKQAPPEEEAPPRPRVRVVSVQPGPAALTLTVAGQLSAPPGRDVKLAPLVAGKLARLLVSEGDSVRAEQVLGEVEAGQVTDELQQAEATAREAEAAVQAAESKRKRTEVLVEHGVAAREEAEQALSSEAASKAALQRAQAALDQAHRKIRHSELKAPFDGVVTAVFIHQGEAVDGNGLPVIQVASVDPLELRAFVTPAQAARIRPGLRASLTIEGQPDVPGGEVIKVSPAIDAQNGNILARVRFPNPTGALRIGSLGRAHILTGEEKEAVIVPASAILPVEDGGLGVAILDEDKVHTLPVTVHSEEEGQAVVQGALKGGERVIVEGGYSLPEGAEVEVMR